MLAHYGLKNRNYNDMHISVAWQLQGVYFPKRQNHSVWLQSTSIIMNIWDTYLKFAMLAT